MVLLLLIYEAKQSVTSYFIIAFSVTLAVTFRCNYLLKAGLAERCGKLRRSSCSRKSLPNSLLTASATAADSQSTGRSSNDLCTRVSTALCLGCKRDVWYQLKICTCIIRIHQIMPS